MNMISKLLDPLIENICSKIEKSVNDHDIYLIGTKEFFKRTYLVRRSQDKKEEYSHINKTMSEQKMFGCYLQRFFCGDDRNKYHNHPWSWSFSFILTNGYIEHRYIQGKKITRILKPGAFNIIMPQHLHYIELIDKQKDCLTLFFVGPIIQDWGYWDEIMKKFKLWYAD